jgi:hypothetical protein
MHSTYVVRQGGTFVGTPASALPAESAEAVVAVVEALAGALQAASPLPLKMVIAAIDAIEAIEAIVKGDGTEVRRFNRMEVRSSASPQTSGAREIVGRAGARGDHPAARADSLLPGLGASERGNDQPDAHSHGPVTIRNNRRTRRRRPRRCAVAGGRGCGSSSVSEDDAILGEG